MAPGSVRRCGTWRRGARLTLAGPARRRGEDTRAAGGGGFFPARYPRRGPGPELANICGWEVAGFR